MKRLEKDKGNIYRSRTMQMHKHIIEGDNLMEQKEYLPT
jgi:hypothetical protein